MAAPLRKRIKRRTRSASVRAAIRLLGPIPLVPALWLGGVIGRLAHALAGRTRRSVLAHRAIAFPEKSGVEREVIACAGIPNAVIAKAVSFDPPDREAEVVRLTAACTAALEAAIRRHPAEWVWKHERWKTRPEGAPPEATQAKAVPKTAALSGH